MVETPLLLEASRPKPALYIFLSKRRSLIKAFNNSTVLFCQCPELNTSEGVERPVVQSIDPIFDHHGLITDIEILIAY